MVKLPRILIAAPSSGTGKTLITCGLLQALVNRNMKVCSFKCGPDYIDPMFHKKIIGTRSSNMDSFFAEDRVMKYLMAENGRDMDIAVFEGVMGYYDGLGGTTDRASTYEVATKTDTPVILVVNAKGSSLSIGATVKGFLSFRKDSKIVGIILNQTTEMMFKVLAPVIQRECGIPVIGYVPMIKDCQLESRHLGLVMPDEIQDIKGQVQKMAQVLEESLDIDRIVEIAQKATPIEEEGLPADLNYKLSKPVRIGLARDEAFCFLYEDNIRFLKNAGAEIVEFSPIHDSKLPENLQGMILCGGYPELYAGKLAANLDMMDEIKKAIIGGMPCIAECGGFIYLHEEFEDEEGNVHRGVGIIPAKAYRTQKLGRFGYISLVDEEGRFAPLKGNIPAHEFHYYDSQSNGDSFTASKPTGKRSWKCIHQSENMIAGFPHFYYYGNGQLPIAFLKKCERNSKC